MSCKICAGATEVVGEKTGRLSDRRFVLRRCQSCSFSFVENPWLDYAAIYDSAYYEGRGADPSVDYCFELAEPRRTIRRLEWAGIVEVVGRLTALQPRTRWLDFGCGNGGLVRYAREAVGCEVLGFEQGAIAAMARASGLPVLEQPGDLDALAGSCDVVTAIEVLEHVVDPLETLRSIRNLLRPGGTFFYTTGNAAPFHDRLLTWRYFVPEIHISLYEPASMDAALRRSGFAPRDAGFVPGWDKIIAFKVLKNLGVRKLRAAYRGVPWRLLAPRIDGRYRVTAFPVALAA